MSSVPDGRAANQPLSATTFTPPIGAPLPGALRENGLDLLAGQIREPDLLRRQSRQQLLLLRGGWRLDAIVSRLAELAREVAIDLAGIAAHARGDLRRQQRRDDAVLVGRPDAAVPAQERRARALLAAEPERAVEQAVDEPLEAHRHLVELAAELRGDAIDHLAAHHASCRSPLPRATWAGAGRGRRSRPHR